MDYEAWCALSDAELANRDIAELNLACAEGLPGSEGLDIPACLARLDQWTDLVRRGTSNALRDWAKFPEYRDWSEPRYRIASMAAVIQFHLGLTYNLAFVEGDYDGRDSRDLFIHGILMQGYPANCSTAPFLYAAIGRRLGYPIQLVKTRQHLFCRWDDPSGERFNIEATNPGFYSHPDEYYQTWPKPVNLEAVRLGIFLRSLSPREDLALLMSQRGRCLLENLRAAESLTAFEYACQADPRDFYIRNAWRSATLIDLAMEEAKLQGHFHDPDTWQIPAPRDDWEGTCYYAACEELRRILFNWRTKDFVGLRELAVSSEARGLLPSEMIISS